MNTIYLGDCLDVLRDEIPSESVDLIYIDPPFNSKRDYNIFFDSKEIQTQRVAFEDTWTLTNIQDSLTQLQSLETDKLYKLLNTYHEVAPHAFPYLVMMSLRILELQRVLKATGSFFLHCDSTMSHYLKTVCDVIFDDNNFRGEIIWKRASGFKRSTAKKFPQKNDNILHFSKTDDIKWNPQFKPHKKEYLERFKQDKDGRFYRDDVNPTKGGTRVIYLDDVEGDLIDSVWVDIPPINPVAKERLGYPTQKPKALLERIIGASSNEGDVVLDAFCGCGTTIDAAEGLHRKWIGIDISPIAISLIKRRLKDTYKTSLSNFEVRGVPKDEPSAIKLWEENPWAFQDWWLTELEVFSNPPGADKGIDGIGLFKFDKTDNVVRVAYQVKGGKVQSKDIDALIGVLRKHKCELGIFLTKEQPTKAMLNGTTSAGIVKFPPNFKYPAIQILTLKDFFNNKHPKLPPINITFRSAKTKGKHQQYDLGV